MEPVIEIAVVGLGTFGISAEGFVFAKIRGRQGVFTVPALKNGESKWRLVERLADIMATSEEEAASDD